MTKKLWYDKMNCDDYIAEISKGCVEQIRRGYELEIKDCFYAPASITLVKDLGLSLIDTGSPGEKESNVIIQLLKNRGVSPENIERVFVTHEHSAHRGNNHLFKNAEVIEPDSRYSISGPNYVSLINQELYKKPGRILRLHQCKNLSAIATPGHSGQDLSFIYSCDGFRLGQFKIAIVGDLFWSEEDWNNDSKFERLCLNPKMQRKSRDFVRKLKPNVVIPGHGPAFMVNNS